LHVFTSFTSVLIKATKPPNYYSLASIRTACLPNAFGM
jgi:hypothetical protein